MDSIARTSHTPRPELSGGARVTMRTLPEESPRFKLAPRGELGKLIIGKPPRLDFSSEHEGLLTSRSEGAQEDSMDVDDDKGKGRDTSGFTTDVHENRSSSASNMEVEGDSRRLSGMEVERDSPRLSDMEVEGDSPRVPDMEADVTTPNARLAATCSFGIKKEDLEWMLRGDGPMQKRHELFVKASDKYRDRYKDKKRYVEKPMAIKNAEGIDEEVRVLMPTRKSMTQRYLSWQIKTGRKVQTKANNGRRLGLDLVGKPRKKGSSYGTDKAKDELLIGSKTLMANHPNAAINAGEALNGANNVVAAVASTPVLSEAGGALASASLAVNVFDVFLVSDPYLKTKDMRQKAKDNLIGQKLKYENFMHYLGAATVDEAEAYLKFDAAGDLLVKPSREDKSAWLTHRYRMFRLLLLFKNSLIGAVSQVVNAVASSLPVQVVTGVTRVSPILNEITAAVSLLASLIDLREAWHERLRRVGLISMIMMRKRCLDEFLTAQGTLRRSLHKKPLKSLLPAEEMLLLGLIDGLHKSQDALLRIAKREKGFGKIQAGKAMANAELAAVTIGLGGAAIAGVIAGPPTLGASLAVSAGLAAVWGATLAYRDDERAVDETTAKEFQRTADILTYALTREELEALMRDNRPVTVAYGEGDHLGDGKFAGGRVVSFFARENPYLTYHLMARKLQDLVLGGNYEVNSPIMQILHVVLGIHPIKLLAMCKAASAKEGRAQVDFLGRIAASASWKFRVDEKVVQAPPHESFFIGEFEAATKDVINELKRDDDTPIRRDDAYWQAVRTKLGDGLKGEGAMDAFVKGIDVYLEKTKHDYRYLDGVWDQLDDFVRWLKRNPVANDQGRAAETGASSLTNSPKPGSDSSDARSILESQASSRGDSLGSEGTPVSTPRQPEAEPRSSLVGSSSEDEGAQEK